MQAVSRRAEVNVPAIYRRWPTRLDLIIAVVAPEFVRLEIEATGDLTADINAFVRAYAEVLDSPICKAALPGLMTAVAATGDDSAYRDLFERLGSRHRPAFHAVLAAAAPGEVDPGVDPDIAFDVLIGAASFRAQIHPFTGRTAKPGDIADFILRALRP